MGPSNICSFADLILSALTSKSFKDFCQQKHVNAYFIKIVHFGDKICLIVLKGPYKHKGSHDALLKLSWSQQTILQYLVASKNVYKDIFRNII